MAKAAVQTRKVIDFDLAQKAFAKSVDDGDMVTFNILFASLSPLRAGTTEILETEKYEYLRPDAEQENSATYKEAMIQVKDVLTWDFIKKELEAERPAQLPSELLILLADNAVRRSKFTMASQAYEMLRIRRRMQSEFFTHADEALRANDIPKAVQGYLVATGLVYDYAAFPEPLPKVAHYQTTALQLHGHYPRDPQDCIAVQPEEIHTNAGLNYLLNDDEAFTRLIEFPLDTRLAFLKELITRIDTNWDEFVAKYKNACALIQQFADRMEHQKATLEDEIEEQQGHNPDDIMIALLGRKIEDGSWWQYLKELAYEHPAGVLFISRLRVGNHEILKPSLLAGSAVSGTLGLAEGISEAKK